VSIHLRLLGPLELRAGDESELSAVLKQPKRLALLAYLAASAPHRFHRRDTLLALFWPDLDDAHARSALRRALYFLRKELGTDSITGRGDEVSTAADVLWCDVAAFREAVQSRRETDAMELYRGDLLEGVFVSSAPEFEHWVDSERTQLRMQAAEAAWSLAGKAERAGDLRDAARWGRRAAAFAPDDEAVARRLIALLDRVGDGAAALQAYEALERHLTTELDLEPSPETRALIESVRARPAMARAQAAAARRMAANLIAVLPFTVRGGEAVAYLREGIVDLLSAKLDRAGDIGTVDPRALLQYVQTLGVIDIHRPVAESVARQFNTEFVIWGSVVAAGDQLHISATLYNPKTADEVRADVEAEEETLIPAVDRLVLRLLAQRPGSLGGQLGRLAAVTTDSLPALKEHLAGERAFRAGRYAEAMAAYERAIRSDPEFSLAHYRLSTTYAVAGMHDKANQSSARAWTYRQRLSAHTQLLLQAQAAWLSGDATSAEACYMRVVTLAPESVDGWFLLGDVGFHLNPLRGRSISAARQPLERALALDPKHIGALTHLIRLAGLDRDVETIDVLLTRFLDLHGSTDGALALRAIRAFSVEDAHAQQQLMADLRTAGSWSIGNAAAAVSLYTGNLSAADRLAESGLARATTSGQQTWLRLLRAHLALVRGDHEGAKRELAAAATTDAMATLIHRTSIAAMPFVEISQADRTGVLAELERWDVREPERSDELAGASSAHSGILSQVRSYLLGILATQVDAEEEALVHARACETLEAPPGKASICQDWAKGIRARIALRRGDPAETLAILDTISRRYWPHLTPGSPLFAQAGERLLRADALLALGRAEEAVGWLDGLGQVSPFELLYRGAAEERVAAVENARAG